MLWVRLVEGKLLCWGGGSCVENERPFIGCLDRENEM